MDFRDTTHYTTRNGLPGYNTIHHPERTSGIHNTPPGTDFRDTNLQTYIVKKTLLIAALTFVSLGLFAQKSPSKLKKADFKPTVELKTAADSASYAYGMVLAATAKKQMVADFKADIFQAAIKAVLNGDSTRFTVEQSNSVFNEYSKTAQQKAANGYKTENQKFLEENKKRKEVTTTASGLQYEILQKGEGTVNPKATDKVEVHYHGTFIDGRVFDSSVDRGKTASFPLNGVIKGWTEGLQYMHEGDKFKFYIPYNLAYGEQGRPNIKGFSTLLFEVELFKINP